MNYLEVSNGYNGVFDRLIERGNPLAVLDTVIEDVSRVIEDADVAIKDSAAAVAASGAVTSDLKAIRTGNLMSTPSAPRATIDIPGAPHAVDPIAPSSVNLGSSSVHVGDAAASDVSTAQKILDKSGLNDLSSSSSVKDIKTAADNAVVMGASTTDIRNALINADVDVKNLKTTMDSLSVGDSTGMTQFKAFMNKYKVILGVSVTLAAAVTVGGIVLSRFLAVNNKTSNITNIVADPNTSGNVLITFSPGVPLTTQTTFNVTGSDSTVSIDGSGYSYSSLSSGNTVVSFPFSGTVSTPGKAGSITFSCTFGDSLESTMTDTFSTIGNVAGSVAKVAGSAAASGIGGLLSGLFSGIGISSSTSMWIGIACVALIVCISVMFVMSKLKRVTS
jgi:hypothetical protein